MLIFAIYFLELINLDIIIIGCGKVGSKFANIMFQEGHDIVIVDEDVNSFKRLVREFNGITITGISTDQDVLLQAGIENVDALVALTPDDSTNIMVCQIAQEIFKVPRILARIFHPDRAHVFHEFGLETICPTKITVEVIRSMLLEKRTPSNFVLGNDNINLIYVTIEEELEGRHISEITEETNEMIFGVLKGKDFHFANEDIILEIGNHLVVAKM